MVEEVPNLDKAGPPEAVSPTAASQRVSTSLDKLGSEVFPIPHRRPKILIFIKPWDDAVFENLIALLGYIERCEAEMSIEIDIVMPEDLLVQVEQARSQGIMGLTREVTTKFEEENRA